MNAELVKSKEVGKGFAIGIVKQPNYRNNIMEYSVVRMNSESRYITLSRHKSLASAQAQFAKENS